MSPLDVKAPDKDHPASKAFGDLCATAGVYCRAVRDAVDHDCGPDCGHDDILAMRENDLAKAAAVFAEAVRT